MNISYFVWGNERDEYHEAKDHVL